MQKKISESCRQGGGCLGKKFLSQWKKKNLQLSKVTHDLSKWYNDCTAFKLLLINLGKKIRDSEK